MGAEFTFQDFVDDGGKNIVQEWFGQIPNGAKVKFNKWVDHLEGTGPGGWKRPLVETLTDHCAGLFELRAALDGLQYRILGSHSADRKPVLLHCFIKPDDKVDEGECDRAFARKAQVEADPDMHRVEHRQ